MKFRIILVVASCLLSVVIGIVLSQQRLSRELDQRIDQRIAERLGKGAPQPAALTNQSSQAGAQPRTGGKLVIGLSMDTLQEERWKGDRDMFVARARELGAEVEVLDANSDDTRQIQQVKSLLTKEISAMVIIPHDGAAMAEGVRLAHEKGIRVLAYDRLIKNADLDLYATFDNVRVGELQA